MSQQAEETQSDELNIDALENPFIASDGGLATSDSDSEAQARMMAMMGGEESAGDEDKGAPENDSDDQEVSGDQEEQSALDFADLLADNEDKSEPSKEEKRKKSKGLRDQLRDRNQQFDELRSQYEEREQELERIRQEMQEAAAEREELQRSMVDRYNVKDYSEQQDEKVRDLDTRFQRRLVEARINLDPSVQEKFSSNINQLAQYHSGVLNGSVDISQYNEMLETNFGEFAAEVRREITGIHQLVEERTRLVNEGRQKHYQTVIGSYENKVKETKMQLSKIGGMTEEEARESGGSVNAIISVAASRDPEYKKQVEQVRKACTTLAAGIRPFDIRDPKWQNYIDPVDMTRLTPEGERLRQLEVQQYERSQQQLPEKLAEAWSASILVPQMAREIARLRARLGDAQSSEPSMEVDQDEPAPREGGLEGSQIKEEDLDDPMAISNPMLKQFV